MQQAFREAHGLQCGFCTPGFVVSVTAFLRDHPDPTDDEIRDALSGNLCRCTGYQGIINAVRLAAAECASERRHGHRRQRGSSASASRGAKTPGSSPGRGRYVDDIVVPGMLHVGLRPQRRRPRHDHVDRRRRGRGPCDGVVAVFTGADLNSAVRESWVDFEGPAGGTPDVPSARRGRRPLRRRADRPRRRRVALRRRGRRRARRGRDRHAAEPSSVSTPPWPTAHRSSTASSSRQRGRQHAGRRRPRARRDLRRRRPRRHRDVRPAPLPLRADGDPRHRRPAGTRRRESLTVWISTQGPHGVRGFLSRALGIAENRVRVDHARRRRRVRPEDVHAARRAGRRRRRPVVWGDRSSGSRTGARTCIADQHARQDRDDRQRRASTATAASSACTVDLLEDVGVVRRRRQQRDRRSSAMLFAGPYRIPKVRLLGARRVHEHVPGAARTAARG